MTMELEQTIMNEIGFCNNFVYLNGTSTCEWLRKEAANKLEAVILQHVKDGVIVAPNKQLIELVKKIAEFGETDEHTLTKTWQAVSEVIQAHILAVELKGLDRMIFMQEKATYIENQYGEELRKKEQRWQEHLEKLGEKVPSEVSDNKVFGPATSYLEKRKKADTLRRVSGEGGLVRE